MIIDDHRVVPIPTTYPASVVYIDESGTASDSRFFVVGALKVRRHGKLMRAVRQLRDQTDFREEFRFNRISHGKLPVYYGLADLISQSGIHFAACVVDREVCDPFLDSSAKWKGHLDVTARLLRGCINRRELVTVSMDLISTPPDIALEDELRRAVNNKLKNLSVVTAACLDSKACDGLQVVDVLAGALAFDRRRAAGLSGAENSHKAKVVARVKAALDTDLSDGRTRTVNIATYRRTASKRHHRTSGGFDVNAGRS